MIYTTGLYQGQAPEYVGTMSALRGLARNSELVRGLNANVFRASIITGAQMATYDSSKQYFISKYNFKQGDIGLFALSGCASGLVASLVSAPIDLVKTRIMNDRVNSEMIMLGRSDSNRLYDTTVHCFRRTRTAEGMTALYKGWFASFLRLGPHFTIAFPLLELIRTRVFGEEAYTNIM